MSARGRLAPSPTGDCHLGNVAASLVAWWAARAAQDSLVLRIEDLDPARSKKKFIDHWIADLKALGLDWDEGPDQGGSFAPYVQSERMERYKEAFEQLKKAERVYACFCTRKDVRAAASAPQLPGDELHYSGTCREISKAEATRRIDAGEPHCWRFKVPNNSLVQFNDLIVGAGNVYTSADLSDFVVWRRDAAPAYQLAVVVDDHAMQVKQVVRGRDLLTSTAKQILLFEAFQWKVPTYAHLPLLCDANGVRLSKRQQDITIRELWALGWKSETIVGSLAHVLGLRETEAPMHPREVLVDFDLATLSQLPERLCLNLDQWRTRFTS